MGIALPQLPQPGETTRAVLYETERAWLLLFALLALGLTLAAVPQAVPLTILFSTAVAFGYGLLADFSDLLFGFLGDGRADFLPLFLLLAWLLMRVAKQIGQWLAAQLLLFGVVFPCVAGLDAGRATLYLDLCGLVFLAFVAWLLATQAEQHEPQQSPAVATSPVDG